MRQQVLFFAFLFGTLICSCWNFPQDITWVPCSPKTETRFEQTWPNITFHCATIKVPLDWQNPNYKLIDYHIIRAYDASLPSPPVDQLWTLNGGPGASSSGIEYVGMWVSSNYMTNNPVTVYAPDHRGTGLSSCLGCNITACKFSFDFMSVDFKACAQGLYEQYKDDTLFYTTTNAAKDIDYAVGLVKNQQGNSNGKVYLYGVSYGTYLANRYGVVANNVPDAIVLDSLCPADICRLDTFDMNWDNSGRTLFSRCGTESQMCRQMLGRNPNNALQIVKTKLDQGLTFCNGQVNLNAQIFAATNLFFTPVIGLPRVLLPPLISRILRCSASDIKEVNHFFSTFQRPPPERVQQQQISMSLPLLVTITLSELFDTNPKNPLTLEQAIGVHRDLVFTQGFSMGLAKAKQYWRTYTPDKYWNRYSTESATLILSGDMDPQTPHFWAEYAATHYTQPNQYYMTNPYGLHGVVLPMENNCGSEVMGAFLTNQNQEPSSACFDSTTMDFDGVTTATQEQALKYFGTKLLWGSEN